MDVVIGLGANLGDRKRSLVFAVSALGTGIEVGGISALYETDPIGPPQPDYLNAALRCSYSGDARSLLGLLLEVERRLGRERREPWGPRILDLDVLWISGAEVRLPDLVVPHPRLSERRFALEPLLDVAPDAVHPATAVRYRDVLLSLPPGGVRRIAGPEWARGA